MKYFLFSILSVCIMACGGNTKPGVKEKPVAENDLASDTLSRKPTGKLQATEEILPSEDDCVFDTSYYKFTSEALHKYKSNIHFKWNNEKKQAMTVLSGGDTLFLSIGGCTHFNYSAELSTGTAFENEAALIKRTHWLAKTFFRNSFADQYLEFLDRKQYQLEREENGLRYYEITIDSDDEEPTNEIFNGFSFESQAGGQRTRISISAYVN